MLVSPGCYAHGVAAEASADDHVTSQSERDRTVVKAVRAGHVERFAELERAYHDRVYRIARRSLSRHEDAEDLTQEVFLRAFRSLHSFRIDLDFWPWLRAIAYKQARTHYSRRRREEDMYRAASHAEQRVTGEDPAAVIGRREMARAVTECLRELPPHLRTPVEHYYFAGRSVFDIADELELSRENVKVRLHRARKRLEELLEERGYLW